MQLIVAGLGRTGTQSLVAALDHLGLTTRSQQDLLADLDLLEAVLAAVEGDAPLDWARWEGVDATVGWPQCWLVAEQAARWPDAPVLLNLRDPDAWFDSVVKAMGVLRALTRVRIHRRLRVAARMLELLEARMGGPLDRETWTAGYRAHAAAIRAAVPPDRLVEWHLGDGWGPLCAALGMPTPDVPFPRSNSSADFRTKAMRLLRPG